MNSEYDWIRERLLFLAKEYKKIVILPMGIWGKLCREILVEETGEDIIGLDNYNYNNFSVFPLDRKENWDKATLYLITAQDDNICLELEEQCKRYVDSSQIMKLFSVESIPQICQIYGRVHLDFLCVGFQKCGTSSLQEVLIKHPDIFLPSNKETFLAHHMYSAVAHENFRKVYERSNEKKFVGGIEPTYMDCASTVFHYFGSNLKIFLCVRNPRKALYSLFKMNMRDSKNALYYMKKYGKISAESFDEWVEKENDKKVFRYIDSVKEYLKYYDKDNIKIVVFEDLITNTENTMNELQEYIGINADSKVKYDKMPHINEGTTVPRDLASVYVNERIFGLVCSQPDVELQTAINNLRGRISEITNIEYCEEMSSLTAQKLDLYYQQSINELEIFMGKSLKGMWY